MTRPLSLFYKEPDPDRWFPGDRYPRRIIRRIVRVKLRPGGQMMVFLNLKKGLEKINMPFRVNDFKHCNRHQNELACIIGKPHVLFNRRWKNPVVFGSSVFSHPIDCPDLFKKYPVKKILVPGEWMKQMFLPYYGEENIEAWPVGIDTELWIPGKKEKTIDFLIYDKIYWGRKEREVDLLNPILENLDKRKLSWKIIRYNNYSPSEYLSLLQESKAMIFLSPGETQGIAYQEALSSGVPVLAWDREGPWLDPAYYPHKVNFGPISSVPYWDSRCGEKFKNVREFGIKVDTIIGNLQKYKPREYIIENLTLEKCASKYLEIVQSLDF